MSDIGRVAIIGCGHMGTALLGGLLNAGLARPDQLTATARREEVVAELGRRFGIHTTLDNRLAVQQADVVVLAVKPQVVGGLMELIGPLLTPDHLLISILAGLTTAEIERFLPEPVPVLRAMPNIAALVDASATALCAGEFAAAEDLDLGRRIFESVGTVEVVEDEALMDAVTGLSGSGPAYIYMVIEALTDGGVKMGLSRKTALRLATQAVLGAARLVQVTGEHPAVLRDQVTTPGGTAIAAIHELETHGLRTMLISAVVTATERSRQLSGLLAPGDRP